MGTAGLKNYCAFFLIWGYFIIHLVLFRPWGSLPNQICFTKKKTLCDHRPKLFLFNAMPATSYYQSPEPSRPMLVPSLSL
jgi:hypothetical protein